MIESTRENGIHRFSRLTAASTLLLLVAGGLVTSTGSGLAVPDWPLSFGQFFPRMVGGVLYEHGHRMIAGTVALLIAALAIALYRSNESPAARRLGLAALLAVMAQALLGGATVLLKLPAVVSVAHACLAQGVFAIVVSIAILTSRRWKEARVEPDAPPSIRRWSPWVPALAFGQLLLGAVLRHTQSGLEAHLFGASIVVVAVALLASETIRERDRFASPRLPRLALGAVGLVALQVALGVSTLFATSMGRVRIATAHVAVGALLLVVLVAFALWANRTIPAPAPAGEGAATGPSVRPIAEGA